MEVNIVNNFILLNKKTLEVRNIEKKYICPFLLGKYLEDWILIVTEIKNNKSFIFPWPHNNDILTIERSIKLL